MSHNGETVLEIDLAALEHNYRYLRSQLNSDTKFLGVVKAYAYGSEAVAIAKKLEALGADYIAVAYAPEGIALRQAGIRLPIMVLHPQLHTLEAIISNGLEPVLYSMRILKGFAKISRAMKQRAYPVHLKCNTGLNRLGFEVEHVSAVATQVLQVKSIALKSVFSHLAASEDLAEEDFTRQQIQAFTSVINELENKVGPISIKHLLNTSGILNYPEAQFNMVRSGIGLYGYGNAPKYDRRLIPVATLKTSISQLHRVEPGKSVGYNRAFIASKNHILATLPIGHADGIGRMYGKGKAWVTINGKKAPIVGNVCMDMLMVDVSNIPCKEGDLVLVFGQGAASAETLAQTVNSISYELLTGISQRVRRNIL